MYPTLIFSDQAHSPQDIAARVRIVCAGFEAHALRQGDTVAVMLRNSPALVVLALACRAAGLYVVPVNWHFKSSEVDYLLQDSGAKALFVHAGLLGQIRDALRPELMTVAVPDDGGEELAPQDLSSLNWQRFGVGDPPMPPRPGVLHGAISYTSGTTGRPKGVRRLKASPERAERMQAQSLRINTTVFGVKQGDVALLCAPIYHSAPMSYLQHCCAVGGVLVLESGFQAEKALHLIERHGVTHAYLVPTMFQRLLALDDAVRRKYDTTSLRHVTSTGSPCAPDLKRRMIAWLGPVITEAYASSETGYLTFIDSPDWLAHPGSAGLPLNDAKVEVRGETGDVLPPGEVGVIYARQPWVPDFEYLNKPEERASCERDGLVTLGDMGYLDEEGYLYISDRKADMIISGGVNIYPAEIELVIQTMFGIADCAVFGIPDQEFGETIAAAVQTLPGVQLTTAEICTFVGQRLANFKVPRVVTFHDQLPREDTGKIFKRLLREPYWAGQKRRI